MSYTYPVFAVDQFVKIYPHGHPDESAVAQVNVFGPNFIMLYIPREERRRPYTTAIHFAGYRQNLNGKPWGPWVEVMNGGHWEIEPV